MKLLGPELVALELRHPDADGLRRTLEALGVDGLAGVEQDERPSLSCVFRLPDGGLRTVGA
jgi:hypothetical protein